LTILLNFKIKVHLFLSSFCLGTTLQFPFLWLETGAQKRLNGKKWADEFYDK